MSKQRTGPFTFDWWPVLFLRGGIWGKCFLGEVFFGKVFLGKGFLEGILGEVFFGRCFGEVNLMKSL